MPDPNLDYNNQVDVNQEWETIKTSIRNDAQEFLSTFFTDYRVFNKEISKVIKGKEKEFVQLLADHIVYINDSFTYGDDSSSLGCCILSSKWT